MNYTNMQKKVKKVFWYKEFGYDNIKLSILNDLNKKNDFKEIILNYMKNGIYFRSHKGLLYDVISKDKKNPIGVMTVNTDGEWAWPTVAIFYIIKYDLDIPEQFIKSIQNKNFELEPNFDISQLRL